MRIFLYLLLFFSLFACAEKHPYPRVIMPDKEDVVLVNTKEMLEFFSYSFLIGNIDEDTDVLEKNIKVKDDNKLFVRINPDTLLPNYKLKIIVDTTYKIYANGFVYKNYPKPENPFIDGLINGKTPTLQQLNIIDKEYKKNTEDIFKLQKKFVQCYPLLVLNKTKDSVFTRFKFIQEAKDFDGNWKPIEVYNNFGGCGNPEMWHYKLAFNKYMIYPVIKYRGDFKTKMRVKVYNKGNVYYSNEYNGFINKSQFDTSVIRNDFEKSFPNDSFKEFEKIMFLERRS